MKNKLIVAYGGNPHLQYCILGCAVECLDVGMILCPFESIHQCFLYNLAIVRA